MWRNILETHVTGVFGSIVPEDFAGYSDVYGYSPLSTVGDY